MNLIAWDNGFGLTKNLRLLREALAAGGHRVDISAIRRGKLRKIAKPWAVRARVAWRVVTGRPRAQYDVNLMLEHVRAEFAPLARHNVLMPHPEWFDARDRKAFGAVDRVFALTQHAVPIFERLGRATDYVGFTSEDRLDRAVPRERMFFHLAGRSQNKGTEPLLALWRRHPEWPTLTVVQNPRSAKPGAPAANIRHLIDYIDDAELKRLQNAHRFHLCPSETEGFGHYLVEAMSVGATILTLDAPPMNEMIASDRGLRVGTSRTGTQNLATTFFFDDAAMTAAIEAAIGRSDAELDRYGAAARAWYDDNDRAFRARIAAAVAALD
ncbi:MAG TPA: glycosyltransferase [Rudaea sp.]|nr:glycosyltransferase [Rudaea sp.]